MIAKGKVTVNTGCTFVDCNKITIGSNVLIAPNVQIYTATHPVELYERLTPIGTAQGTEYIRHTYALPVTIEDGCWIGGGVIILPGVTIGKGSVIFRCLSAAWGVTPTAVQQLKKHNQENIFYSVESLRDFLIQNIFSIADGENYNTKF